MPGTLCETLRTPPDGPSGLASAALMETLDKVLVGCLAVALLFAIGALTVTALLKESDRPKGEQSLERPDSADETRAATVVLLHGRSIQGRDPGSACRLLTGRAALQFGCDTPAPSVPARLALPAKGELTAAGAEVEGRRATVELAVRGTSRRQLYRLVRAGASWQISTVEASTGG